MGSREVDLFSPICPPRCDFIPQLVVSLVSQSAADQKATTPIRGT